MRCRVWGMLVAESPLTSAQIHRRLNHLDTEATQRKLIPYSTTYKYLTDLSSWGLVDIVDIEDQSIRGSSAYRVNDESIRMYEIAQQAQRQLVEVIRSRPDPQLASFIKDYGREGILALAREAAKRDPDGFRTMVEEIIQEESLSTEHK